MAGQSTTRPTACEPWPDDARLFSPLGHRMMFLVLTTLAFCLFAPVTLLPVIADHCALLEEEQRIGDRVATLKAEIRRQDRLREAFLSDPVINERLAQLDLHYKRPNELIMPVLPENHPAEAVDVGELIHPEGRLNLPAHAPAWARDAEAWAGEYGILRLFLDRAMRHILLLMAGGLLVAAFVLFAPTPPRRAGAMAPATRHRPAAV